MSIFSLKVNKKLEGLSPETGISSISNGFISSIIIGALSSVSIIGFVSSSEESASDTSVSNFSSLITINVCTEDHFP